MSTRSCLAIRQPEGHIYAIYCHSDGYPSYNGKLLMKHYHGFKGARHLFRHGDMSCLNETIGVKHDFNWRMNIDRNFSAEFEDLPPKEKRKYLGTDGKPNRFTYEYAQLDLMPESKMCTFYRRDRDEQSEPMFGEFPCFLSLYDAYRGSMCEYLYLFAGGTWWTDAGIYSDDWEEGMALPHLRTLMGALERDKARAVAENDEYTLRHYEDWDRSQVGPEPYLPRRAARLGYGHDDPPVHRVASGMIAASMGNRSIQL